MTGQKKRISASIESDLKEQLDNKAAINKSQLIETLLREYLANGESTTVALKVRREELRKQKQNKELQKKTLQNEIESLENQIEELTEKIKERRQAGLEGVDEIVEKIEAGEMTTNFLDETNPVISNKASKAGVPAQRFVKEVHERL